MRYAVYALMAYAVLVFARNPSYQTVIFGLIVALLAYEFNKHEKLAFGFGE